LKGIVLEDGDRFHDSVPAAGASMAMRHFRKVRSKTASRHGDGVSRRSQELFADAAVRTMNAGTLKSGSSGKT